ncbi:MAG: putative quinol monooxygenase [Psychroflexus sp.]|uniref:putative quinol monooxygenase n=1 Tax=Psychroflexus sp. S27 TaxID=1982757 RepID=UPI000C2A0570|nr:antibiotic biosynthesis monooxygenase family protein [Psychroflexus sp. S27]PJX24443.1 antibiotic biosynthesis monooxygenase [Psychroflexus sp. S27]
MIVRVVKMIFKPEAIEDFKLIFETSKNKIKSQKGCLYLSMLQDIKEPQVFFTYSYWDNEEDLNNYRKSELFGSVWPKTKMLFADKPEAWSLHQHSELT